MPGETDPRFPFTAKAKRRQRAILKTEFAPAVLAVLLLERDRYTSLRAGQERRVELLSGPEDPAFAQVMGMWSFYANMSDGLKDMAYQVARRYWMADDCHYAFERALEIMVMPRSPGRPKKGGPKSG